MKIKVIASTKPGYIISKEEALIFSGKAAGICYLPNTIKSLFSEPLIKTETRVQRNIVSGHHSVFGHVTYNLILEKIPKILAMILNNEKVYNTSEKSARYTTMETSSKEKELYEKWTEIYIAQITKEYPYLDKKKIKKLSQENARYLISVFTPATVMEYSVNLQQLNYIINWTKDYIEKEKNTRFSLKLKNVLKEFLQELSNLEVNGLDSKMKGRSFSLFSLRERKEEFGENYCINYLASFAQLAQAQRHRTLSYEMSLLETPQYYVPPIIKGTELEIEWKKDIYSLEEYFPQGMLIQVNERGTVENFVLKCTERLCGAAQLEIMEQTKKTMNRYISSVKSNPAYTKVYEYLLSYSKGSRCTFPGWQCNSPCIFGKKNALHRKI